MLAAAFVTGFVCARVRMAGTCDDTDGGAWRGSGDGGMQAVMLDIRWQRGRRGGGLAAAASLARDARTYVGCFRKILMADAGVDGPGAQEVAPSRALLLSLSVCLSSLFDATIIGVSLQAFRGGTRLHTQRTQDAEPQSLHRQSKSAWHCASSTQSCRSS